MDESALKSIADSYIRILTLNELPLRGMNWLTP